jgi:hypothetical protein
MCQRLPEFIFDANSELLAFPAWLTAATELLALGLGGKRGAPVA